jgi:hypothetical protein
MKALMPAPMESAAQNAGDLENGLPRKPCHGVPGGVPDYRQCRRMPKTFLQTVFLRMLKRDGRRSRWAICRAFCIRSAVNAALDLVRSRANIRNIPLDEIEPVLAEPSHRNPERAQASGEIRDWLRGALARL